LGAETRTYPPFFLQSICPPISVTIFYKKKGNALSEKIYCLLHFDILVLVKA